MAEVIDSLLVRLGLETDAKDFREANALFDGVKTKALQFGAVIGAGLGLQSLTFGFAAAKDELAGFAEVYGTTAQFVDSLGYALQQSGGQARDAFGSIKRIRDLLEDTEWGEVAENAFRVAGFDPYLLQGVTDVTEAYERLAGAVQGLSQEDARRALSSLGFSDAEIRLFRSGPESLRQTLAEAESYARVTKEMTDKASRFSAELTKLTKSVEGVGNELSNLLLDDFSDAMKQASDYLRDNRSEIAEFFKEALPWLEKIAIGIGTLVAIQAGKSALGYLGAAARHVPTVAAVAGAAAVWDWKADDLEEKTGIRLPDWVFEESPVSAFRKFTDWIGKQGIGAQGASGGLGDLDILSGVVPRSAPDVPPPAAAAETTHTTYEIHVDARGATSPAATEEAAERGAEAALARMASQAVTEMKDIE